MTAPRPKTLTSEMATRVAAEIAADLVKCGEIKASEVEACTAHIARRGRRHMDGYDLARDLEQYHHWSPTAEMVEQLANFGHLADSEIEAAQEAWAAENNIQPPFPVGARVQFRGSEAGEITEIYKYGAAKYCVKADGDPKCAPPTNARHILNFEDVTEIAPVVA